MPDSASLKEKNQNMIHGNDEGEGDEMSLKGSVRCFLSLLYPTPNFSSTSESIERYKYMFSPGDISELQRELYSFLGQFVGIAIRSKITLDLPLPSYIWKCIAREPLTEKDVASFDATAAHFVDHLGSLNTRLKSMRGSVRTARTVQCFESSQLPSFSTTSAASTSATTRSISLFNGHLSSSPKEDNRDIDRGSNKEQESFPLASTTASTSISIILFWTRR